MVPRPSQGASPALRGCWGWRAGGRMGQTLRVLSPLGRLEVDTPPPVPLGWDLPPRWPRPFSCGPGAPGPVLCAHCSATGPHARSVPTARQCCPVPPQARPHPLPGSSTVSSAVPQLPQQRLSPSRGPRCRGTERGREGLGHPTPSGRAPTQHGDPGLANGPGGTGPFGRSGGTGSTGRARRGRARAWGRRERSPP